MLTGYSHLPHRVSIGIALAWTLLGSAGFAVDYARDIKPLLAEKCYACHGALKTSGGLRLDTAEALMAGGDSGSPVESGSPADSLLIDVLTGDAGFQMPPAAEGAALSIEQIELLRDWIRDGAPLPTDEVPQQDPRTWWSYQTVQRPAIPPGHDEWCRNPVDHFIAAKREQQGLPVAVESAKEIWLRRVYLDLIGLPPTPREQHDFAQDASPIAYERVVDDLLSRPQYGERWGRHWMDVWRYSDWYGSRGINEIRYSQRNLWRWRDWIVASLNRDAGYDQMLQEMLAGDELGDGDPDVMVATGFLGRNWYKFDREAWLFETVERTCEAFLGLTMRCARCHDHKFDPITQQDYFRFRAIFEPHDVRTDPLSAFASTEKDATLGQVLSDGVAIVYDKSLDAITYRFERGDSRFPDKTEALRPGVPAAMGGDFTVQPIDLPVDTWYPSLRAEMVESLREKAEQSVARAEQALSAAGSVEHEHAVAVAGLEVARAERDSLFCRIAVDLAQYREPSVATIEILTQQAIAAEHQASLCKARLDVLLASVGPEEKQSEAAQWLADAEQAVKDPGGEHTPIGDQYPRSSTGRRAALARWLVDPGNPRTSRIAANHLWSRHFGVPLVETTENFGLNGRTPSHPELLDWLACELTAGQWKMKHIHKLLVLSATYRMASSLDQRREAVDDHAVALGRDPENRFYWRMNPRRMEAEVVRDSTLYLADRLDLQAGGREIDETKGEDIPRRSLYFRNTPNESMLMLDVFDVADPNACYRRKQSVVPHQSLAMMNSGLVQDAARQIASRLSGETRFIDVAFETILSRPPTELERARCELFLTDHVQLLTDPSRERFPAGGTMKMIPAADPVHRARENLVHVLLLHNDFVTIR